MIRLHLFREWNWNVWRDVRVGRLGVNIGRVAVCVGRCSGKWS